MFSIDDDNDEEIASVINELNDKDNDIDIKNITNSDDFIDERDEIEWIDTFDLSKMVQDRLQSIESHRWLGADWTLLIIKQGDVSYSLYVGYNDSKHFPVNWSANIMYEFIQIGDDDKETSLNCDTHSFIPNDQGREDRGMNCLKSYPCVVKIKTKLREMSRRVNLTLTQRQQYNSKESTGMVGLINNGATCYLNSLLQMLFNINKFRNAVYQLPHESEIFSESTTLALQSVFKNLQCSNREVSTQELTTAFGWSNQDADIQQDVQEMMRVLLDKLEEKMKGTSVDGTIKSLFGGKFCSYIRCVNVDYESKREEDFYDIQLEVKNCKNIYDSFKKYTEVEMLDGENQYDAGDHGKQDARKGVDFTSFPPVLTIHLKRFDFDFNYMSFIKINDSYEFPAYLELDQFLAEDIRSDEKNNRYLLHSVLVHSGDVGGGHYYTYIRPSNGFDYANTEIDMKHAKEDLIKSSNESDLSKMTMEAAKLKIISEGAGGKWFKFNDEIVTSAQSKEAIKFCFGSKLIQDKKFGGAAGSAYMLVYIKESMASMIMNDTQCEIPSHLLERLESERIRREIERKKEERSKLFSWFRWATENSMSEVRLCECYEYKFVANMMKGSMHLFVLCKIAKELNVSPTLVRLWLCEDSSRERPLMQVKDFRDIALALQHYYAEVIDKNDDENMAEIENIFLEEKKLIEMFSNALHSLGFNEEEIKGCVQGFAIGCPPRLLDLVLYDENLIVILQKEMASLTERMLQLVHSQIEKTDDESIFFLRIFDFQDILPKDLWQLGSTKRKLETNDNNSNNNGTTFMETMKYLGSDKLNYNMSCQSPNQVISDILTCYKSRADKVARQLALQNGIAFDSIMNILFDSFTLYYYLGCNRQPDLIYSKESEIQTYERTEHKSFPSGGEFIISLSRINEKRINKHLEMYYPRLNANEEYNPKGYVYYVYFKREILLFAHSQREKDIVGRTMGIQDNYHPLKKIKYSREGGDNDKKKEQSYSNITLDIPTYLPAYKVLQILSEHIQIPPQRLIIFLTNENFSGIKKFLKPICYDSNDETQISRIAHEMRIAKSFDRIMYVITPFDVDYPQVVNKVKLCISLVDANIRQIHQQHVNYLKSNPSLLNGRDPEFVEEKSIYIELPGYDTNLIYHCMNLIKNEIGLPTDLIDYDTVDLSNAEAISLQRLTSDMIFQVSEDSYKVPKYPILLFLIDNEQNFLKIISMTTRISENCLNDICYGGINIRRNKLCAQHIPLDDLQFMNNLMNIASKIVYVINFTLAGKAVSPCDNFGEPFLSYISEEDDYDSLIARFIQVTGDNEIAKLRIAYIDDKIPHFIVKPSSSSESNNNNSIYTFIEGISKRGSVYLGIQRLSSSIANNKKSIGSITIK